MKSSPYYTKRTTCESRDIKKKVCVCPSGFSGSLCATQLYSQCFVQITEPNLAAGCSDKHEDSDYYVYSIQGYDPCNYFDFNGKTTLKYKLVCKAINKAKVVVEGGHPEGVQYIYRDVFDPSKPANNNTVNVLAVEPPQPFKYGAVNKQTGFKVSNGETLGFTFEFRDWKYLTQKESMVHSIHNAKVIAGLEEGSVEVDFSKLVARDKAGNSTFEVAGRVFWETRISSPGFISYTTNGFFDREGYEEPQLPSE